MLQKQTAGQREYKQRDAEENSEGQREAKRKCLRGAWLEIEC